jgi:hypothetical protein
MMIPDKYFKNELLRNKCEDLFNSFEALNVCFFNFSQSGFPNVFSF